MGEKYFYTESMTVGYQGIPLIQNIKIHIQQGGDIKPYRSKRRRKIYNIKKYCRTIKAFGRGGLSGWPGIDADVGK